MYCIISQSCEETVKVQDTNDALSKCRQQRRRYPGLPCLSLSLLATREAHELYHRYGSFQGSPAPERWTLRATV
jgi:hypothetical protein